MPHALVPSSGGAVIDRAGGSLSVGELQVRRQRVLEVMANVLEADKDYGRIPGTDKPTLYKPGAEMLMLTFQLAAAKPIVEDLSTDDEIRYRVNVPIEAPDGRALAVGVGEASTNQEKYPWRKAVCDEEFNATPETRRRLAYKRGKSGTYTVKQVRTEPADVANTVLKMAKKRGQTDLTLTATAASAGMSALWKRNHMTAPPTSQTNPTSAAMPPAT